MFFALLALQDVPNYADAQPIVTSDARACAREYSNLSDYQGRANGIIIRREVDSPNGYIEFEDSATIRNEIDLAVRPYLDELRRVVFIASALRCHEIAQQGKERVNAVMRVVFRR